MRKRAFLIVENLGVIQECLRHDTLVLQRYFADLLCLFVQNVALVFLGLRRVIVGVFTAARYRFNDEAIAKCLTLNAHSDSLLTLIRFINASLSLVKVHRTANGLYWLFKHLLPCLNCLD